MSLAGELRAGKTTPRAFLDACLDRIEKREPNIGAFVALNHWLATSGYRRTGPCREIYHRSPLHTADPAAYLTEIQYPILAAHE